MSSSFPTTQTSSASNTQIHKPSSLILSIIIVSYNTRDLTLAACKSVLEELQTTQGLKSQAELIVVDNNSSDGSKEALSKLAKDNPMIRCIFQQHNSGFAHANNVAIRQAKGEFLFLLNSDTEVLPGCLKSLLANMHKSQTQRTAVLGSHQGELDNLGILSATLRNPDNTPQPQGGSLPSLLGIAAQFLFLDDLPIIGKLLPSTQFTGRNSQLRFSKNTDTNLIQQGWVGGTAMMIRRKVCQEVGLLDENIFMYGEDMEFCLRATNHHCDIAIDPEAVVIHHGSASSSQEKAICGEISGLVYIWSKHKPAWEIPVMKAILYSGILVRMLLFGTIMRNKKRYQNYKIALKHL